MSRTAKIERDGAPQTTRSGSDLPDGAAGDLISELKTQWKRYRKQLRRCQKKFSEKAIHDSRVETRRLLSFVELLAPFLARQDVRRAERTLKRYLDVFDDLRDTQVQLRASRKLVAGFVAARRFTDYLRKREQRFAKRTARNIRCVKTSRLGKMMNGIARCAASQSQRRSATKATQMVARAVSRAFDRAVTLRKLVDPEDTTTIHCARVAFKKFRYMVEALEKYLPGANKRWLEAMHDYQTVMGDIQDSEVLLKSFDKFACKKDVEPGAVGEFHDELIRRRESLIQRYLGVADHLLAFWPAPEAAPKTRRSGNSRQATLAQGRREFNQPSARKSN